MIPVPYLNKSINALIIACLGVSALLSACSPRTEPLAHRDDLTPEERLRVMTITRTPQNFSVAQNFEAKAGGATTSSALINANVFSHPSANLSFEDRDRFFVGNGIFRKIWVSSPSSTQSSDGLGPLFNARGCQTCHLKDGRGHPPLKTGGPATSMIVALSAPAQTQAEQNAIEAQDILAFPDPVYGGQFQDVAVPGLAAEGQVHVTYMDRIVELFGGESVTLRAPTVSLHNLAYGPLGSDVKISARIAPQMIGLGLLEAIHEGDILSRADIGDVDGDGISGKPHFARDPETGEIKLGRFGWKATTPSVRVQSGVAFSGDMGLSNPVQSGPYGDCTTAQIQCLNLPHGEGIATREVTETMMDLVTFYSQNLAVPERRQVNDPQVLQGKALFHDAGCASCHHPNYVTRRDAPRPEHQFQLIWPYTDMLLHDMGEGLADEARFGAASGREWRTPPLWGIGLTQTVSGEENYLHDGRARTILEAVLWHGGEAQSAQARTVAMTPQERAALIAFVKSL